MGFKTTFSNWARNTVQWHMTDMSSVKNEVRYSQRENAFFMNSPAGHLRFTSRDNLDMQRFRDKFINKFELGEQSCFSVYQEILKTKWSKSVRIKYKANLRTKLRMAKCRLF